MTTHELNGKIICALEVPSDVKDFKMFNDMDRPYLSYRVGVDVRREYVPIGNYKFLTLSKDMTEEVASELVYYSEAFNNYKNYEYPANCVAWDTALESFRTWERSVGIVTVNALSFDPTGITTGDWQQAQSLVKNIAYLVKEG